MSMPDRPDGPVIDPLPLFRPLFSLWGTCMFRCIRPSTTILQHTLAAYVGLRHLWDR